MFYIIKERVIGWRDLTRSRNLTRYVFVLFCLSETIGQLLLMNIPNIKISTILGTSNDIAAAAPYRAA